jgi:hypothetical protein
MGVAAFIVGCVGVNWLFGGVVTLPGIISSQMMDRVGSTPFWPNDYILATNWSPAYYSSGVYDSNTDRTYIAWQIADVNGSDRKSAKIVYYDHTGNTWSDIYTVGNFVLSADDHGVPSIEIDNDGFIYVFFGTHNNAQKWSISAYANDITSWTQQADISGAYTYVHPLNVGGTLYLLFRDSTDLTRRTLILKSGTPAAGSVTFSASSTLVDLGADSRFYMAEAHVVGTEIHLTATRANAADSIRRGVYYFIYDTVTGSVKNFAGTTTVTSGSLPVSLATANSDFLIYNHGSNDGDIPSFNFDTNGNPHIIFADGTTPTYDLKHMWHNGTAWSSPVTIATLTDAYPSVGFVTTYSMVPAASGKMWAVYPVSGDLTRRIWTGTWQSPIVIAEATTLDILDNVSVRNAHPEIRLIFAERTAWTTDADAEQCKMYAFGDGGGQIGGVSTSGSDPNWFDNVLLLDFESRNNAVTCIDSGPTCVRVAAFNANAKIDTTQFKFGTASLSLDGTGDFVTFPTSSAFSVNSGDVTFEAWLRLNQINKLQQIAGKRSSGGTPGEWQFVVTASNVLQLIYYNGASAVLNISGATTLATNTWYHVAFSKSGTTSRVFLDGTLQATGTQSGTPSTNATALHLGRDPSNTGRDLNGRLDEVRMTRVARYTAAFTPPTAAFPRK